MRSAGYSQNIAVGPAWQFLVHTIHADSSVKARFYNGTGDNLQYQIGIFGIAPAGAWVGLSRAYYGTGLQYNAQT